MSRPVSLGLLALFFPSLRRALEHEQKLLLDVVRLNKCLESKEESITGLTDDLADAARDLEIADQDVNELEALSIVLRAKLKTLEKELSTYKNPVIAHMEKNTQLAMALADTKKDLLKATENPLLQLKELPDSKDHCYVWLLSREKDVPEFQTELANTYYEHMGREPQALHLVLHSVEDVKRFTKGEIETKIKTRLK